MTPDRPRTTTVRRLPWWRVVVGCVLLLIAAAGAIWPHLWLRHQHQQGQELLRSTRTTAATVPADPPTTPGAGAATALPGAPPGAPPGRPAHASTGGTSPATPDPIPPDPTTPIARLAAPASERCNPTSPVSVLVINHLGVTAPVQQGITDTVLKVSVGHEPSSPWPGDPGTSLLLSHNVGYFQNLNNLRPRDQIRFTRHCVTRVFTVTGKDVTIPGSVLTAPRNGYGLTLITCWPPNALFWTTERLIVSTELTATITGVTRIPAPAPVTNAYKPALPPGWDTSLAAARQSVGLSTITFTGKPDPSWVQSTLPLQAEHAAVLTYFAAESAVRTGNRTWWAAVTIPGTRMPADWPGTSSVRVHEHVTGTTLQTVTFTAGKRAVTVTFTGDTARVSAVT